MFPLVLALLRGTSKSGYTTVAKRSNLDVCGSSGCVFVGGRESRSDTCTYVAFNFVNKITILRIIILLHEKVKPRA